MTVNIIRHIQYFNKIGNCILKTKRFYSVNSITQPTIYALSTKFGTSAIGVVRVSGPQSTYVFDKLTKSKRIPDPRKATVKKLYSPTSGILLDEALTIFFELPNSYTGENLLEFHLHGGVAIIRSVIKAIKDLHEPSKGIYLRYAEHGEFSRRAFINGKFDLTEIEGIRDVINAETESQRIAALVSSTGGTKQLFHKWREQIVQNIALMTTVIDFGEDHDIEEVDALFEMVSCNITKLSEEMKAYLRKVQGSEILLKGIKLTLVGPPNAGKSSLLNFLANKDAAIVSEIAGTTRDIIDIPLDINGYKVVVGDTAGIRSLSTANPIEEEGIKRAKNKSLLGDFVLLVLPVDQFDEIGDLVDHIDLLKKENKKFLVVLNKEDLLNGPNQRETILKKYSSILDLPKSKFFFVSSITGRGIPGLTEAITTEFKSLALSSESDPIVVSNRIQDLIENDILHGFNQFFIWKKEDDIVLASECLKQSIEGIGKITGEGVGVEEILGVVFSSFCIGK
ncbi:uncharacterized protein PRCAT00005954001 [Priceomyces carsonii]|uniref:uncharacterized protein n=1 Tax=Priceomyces carsonii TaxID=28549 RepID=UPI002EDB33E3|nr:unnamed protein product [Priceomyces carsonii]